jgi:hypothetical protein
MIMPRQMRREPEPEEMRPEPIAEQEMVRDLSQITPQRVEGATQTAIRTMQQAIEYFEGVARKPSTRVRRER